MCCESGHVGAPPEWHKEDAGEVIHEGRWLPTAAQSVAWWRRQFAPPEPGPRPVSTEGGQGRALLTRCGCTNGERDSSSMYLLDADLGADAWAPNRWSA